MWPVLETRFWCYGRAKRSTIAMKSAKKQKCSPEVQCPYCNGTMRLVRDIDLNGLPNIHLYYCDKCRHVVTVKEEKVA